MLLTSQPILILMADILESRADIKPIRVQRITELTDRIILWLLSHGSVHFSDGGGDTYNFALHLLFKENFKYFITSVFKRILAETDILTSFCVYASLQAQGDVEKSV